MNEYIPIRVVYMNERRIVGVDVNDTMASFTMKCEYWFYEAHFQNLLTIESELYIIGLNVFSVTNVADTVYRSIKVSRFHKKILPVSSCITADWMVPTTFAYTQLAFKWKTLWL